MKFQFKSIFTIAVLLMVTNSQARDVILLENMASAKEGEMVMEILLKKFNLPRRLITYKTKAACSKPNESIMQLCLKPNGELEIVKMNKFVVEETLGVFLETEV